MTHIARDTSTTSAVFSGDTDREVLSGRLQSEVVSLLLEQARQRTNMDLAWVSQFADGRQVIEALAGEGDQFNLAPGASSSYDGSYCVRVLDDRLPPVIADARHHPGTQDLAVTHDLGIGAYSGVPIVGANGDVRGMLCCVSKGQNPSVDAGDVRFLELLAGAISAIVSAPGRTDNERHSEFRERIGRVIGSEQLRAVFQPILHLGTARIVGAEALTRFPDGPAPISGSPRPSLSGSAWLWNWLRCTTRFAIWMRSQPAPT